MKWRDWVISFFIMFFILVAAFAADDRFEDELIQAQILDELIAKS